MDTVTTEKCTANLEKELAISVACGWRIESRSDTMAILARGDAMSPTMHLIHLILTVSTAGAWGLVWLILWMFSGEEREIATVDEWGYVHILPATPHNFLEQSDI